LQPLAPSASTASAASALYTSGAASAPAFRTSGCRAPATCFYFRTTRCDFSAASRARASWSRSRWVGFLLVIFMVCQS
ncbi:hypothetical protein NX865_30490, partial [Burkholderia thailandensis]|uniref:hypothetical protein n=1 Tax=Burkholderia thailandensis TaxID=57975 RepID=UPI00217CF082